MTKKYAIHPGYVVSKNDGDCHFISFNRLKQLYRLEKEECVNWGSSYRESIGEREEDYIHIFPRRNGDYSLSCNYKGGQ